MLVLKNLGICPQQQILLGLLRQLLYIYILNKILCVYFRFNLPYLGLFGGVISISARQFKDINGMSNVYDGWGGEDDDLFT